MKLDARRYVRSQGGFTLIEVIIASAIGLMVMTALTSVVLTSVRAASVATGRVEASSQIRAFEQRAYDDFAHSGIPSSCPTPPPTVCIVLTGLQASNSPTPAAAQTSVMYTWDGVTTFLDRQSATGAVTHIATGLTSFSWYVDGTAPYQTVVVSLTVTVSNYSESQTFRFYPRVTP